MEISRRILENIPKLVGGRDLILNRAYIAVYKIRFEEGKVNVVDLRRVIEDLEALLSENTKNNNSVLIRILIYEYLASIYSI